MDIHGILSTKSKWQHRRKERRKRYSTWKFILHLVVVTHGESFAFCSQFFHLRSCWTLPIFVRKRLLESFAHVEDIDIEFVCTHTHINTQTHTYMTKKCLACPIIMPKVIKVLLVFTFNKFSFRISSFFPFVFCIYFHIMCVCALVWKPHWIQFLKFKLFDDNDGYIQRWLLCEEIKWIVIVNIC